MEEIPCEVRYAAEGSYPEVRVKGKNQRIGAAMLSNVGGGTSEMGAVSFYLYGQFMMNGRPEVAECLHCIALVEMHHLAIFSQLARHLGEDPRLWAPFQGRRRYWRPEDQCYPGRLDQFLRHSIGEERSSIRKYEQQARWIGDEGVRACLRRVIEDERVHLEVLTGLYRSYCGGQGEPGRG